MSRCDGRVPLVLSDCTGEKITVCELGTLFPYPFLYRNCNRAEIEGFALKLSTLLNGGEGFEEKLRLAASDAQLSKLYEKAMEATSKDSFNNIHPLRLAAAIVLDNGEIECCWQLKALEYGSTLDPVCQLITIMERLTSGDVRPKYLIMVDQWGNIHAPFAQARAILVEHNYHDLNVIVTSGDGSIEVTTAGHLVPPLPGFSGSLKDTVFR